MNFYRSQWRGGACRLPESTEWGAQKLCLALHLPRSEVCLLVPPPSSPGKPTVWAGPFPAPAFKRSSVVLKWPPASLLYPSGSQSRVPGLASVSLSTCRTHRGLPASDPQRRASGQGRGPVTLRATLVLTRFGTAAHCDGLLPRQLLGA